MQPIPEVRPSPLAGTWYEADPGRLARAVDGYLSSAALPDLPGEVLGVIAPHAGHRYSGQVAGHAFAAVQGRKPALVAVVSPMHQPYSQSFLTTAHKCYATPLGSVPVAEPLVAALSDLLRQEGGVGLAQVAYDREHSLEIELPFLQRALAGPFELLPLMVRTLSPASVQRLGTALAEVLRGQDFLLVASTDLSHFYSQDQAEALDGEMLRRLESFDPMQLFSAEQEGRGFACGLGAVAAVLWASLDLGATSVRVLNHATSGDVTGDYSSVVGYAAAAILKE